MPRWKRQAANKTIQSSRGKENDMDNSEPILVADKTKECPTCGRKIEAVVEECPACGAKFEVTTRAYCTNDHKLIHVDAAGQERVAPCRAYNRRPAGPYRRSTARHPKWSKFPRC